MSNIYSGDGKNAPWGSGLNTAKCGRLPGPPFAVSARNHRYARSGPDDEPERALTPKAEQVTYVPSRIYQAAGVESSPSFAWGLKEVSGVGIEFGFMSGEVGT